MPGSGSHPYDLSVDVLLRILLALIAGTILGFERQHHGRAAGLRTIMIVCLASCVAMVMSDMFYRASFGSGNWSVSTTHPDPARLAAGVLAGMGFLGAGVIIHQQRNNITRGVTTAAILWFSAIVGISFGAGAVGLGVTSTAVATVVLYGVPRFERHIAKDAYADLIVRIDRDSGLEPTAVTHAIEALGAKVKGVSWEEDLATSTRELRYHIKYRSPHFKSLPRELVAALTALPGVTKIHWQG